MDVGHHQPGIVRLYWMKTVRYNGIPINSSWCKVQNDWPIEDMVKRAGAKMQTVYWKQRFINE